MSPRLRTFILITGAILCGGTAATCRPDPGGGGDNWFPWFDASLPDPEDDAGTKPVEIPPERCHIPLDRFTTSGQGALAKRIESAADLIGGPNAHGKPGDFLLANDRIQIVVQGPDRHIGSSPYGATILDAALAGESNDQFGELGLLYNFGRTVEPTHFEIISDGSAGGAAVVAMSGRDTANDYLDIRSNLKTMLGTVPNADPWVELPLRITNYFILNPGEQRLRFVTAFCNEGTESALLSVGELVDPGFTVELFNGQSCTGGFGSGGLCFGLDNMSWFGYQGDDVAYGIAPYFPGTPGGADRPSQANATLTIAGITGALHGTRGPAGLAEWFSPGNGNPSGALVIPGYETRVAVRDFYVGRSVGEIGSAIETARAALTGATVGELSGVVTSGGRPLANARVAVLRTSASGNELAGVFVTDDDGRYEGRFLAGNYRISAWAPGHAPTAEKPISLSRNAPAEANFDMTAPRKLTVTVNEPGVGPIPAKVTVLCASGTCPFTNQSLVKYTDVVRDAIPDNVMHIDFVGASGEATFDLPPGQYHVLVSRGPEYSIHPNNYPSVPGVAVDLQHADGRVDATLVRVLDTTGYMSADFHVHAVNSPDSAVDNHARVLSYAAEGVDVVVSTDHDYITDFAPYIRDLGLDHVLASVIGQEASPMGFGHYNAFPIRNQDDPITGGALDWANPDGPTMSVAEIFREFRKMGAWTIHLNHPRGTLGGFTHLKVDTDTLATHADPLEFRMAPQPGASASDTRLISADFNAFELLNSGIDEYKVELIRPLLNDWFTMLSRGQLVAGTGTSDTHKRFADAAGYYRSFVKMGVDTPAQFSAIEMSDAVNQMKVVATNTPFVRVSAVRVDADGVPTSDPAEMGEVLAASDDEIEVTVEVQVPTYTDITRIELYTHQPGDDGRCPMDPTSPQAQTTRVACNGLENRNWPQSSIAATRNVQLTAAHRRTVKTVGGTIYRRYEVKETFRLPATQTDNWIVALIYGSKPIFPLAYHASGGKAGDVTPFAITNPILIDADGGGYDRPPFNRSLPAGEPPASPAPKFARPVEAPQPSGPITAERLIDAWREAFSHAGGRNAIQ